MLVPNNSHQNQKVIRNYVTLTNFGYFQVLTVLFLLNLAGATFVFRFSRYNARKPITFKDFAFVPESLRFSFGQAFPTTPKDASSRVVYVVLLFMVFIVASTYKSAITAYLARPLWSKTINSAEDLAASSLIPHTPSSTETWEFFMRQNTTPLSRIKEKLQPVGGTDLDAIFFDKISDGRFALVDTYSSAVGSLNLYELRNQRCRFHIGREGYVTVLDVFLYSRNSRVSVHVDRVLRRLRSFGITRYLRRRAYAVPCFTKIEIIARRPLSVGQCEGLMYVYLCSMLVACVAFVLELLWYRLGGPSRLRLQLFKTQATRS
ncbi:Ionotropic glutamate receptor [Trinorchestia longiramus]|nr:Ionotropic glutamate receptor [Trinorchestia longiramus]